MLSRFTLSLHRQANDALSHFDLFFEDRDRLISFKIPKLGWPESGFATSWPRPLVAKRQFDHRTHYLNYTGPISRHRGTVFRIMSGRFRPRIQDPGKFCCELINLGDFKARDRGSQYILEFQAQLTCLGRAFSTSKTPS